MLKIEIKNSFYSDNPEKFINKTNIIFEQDRLEYKLQFDKDNIIISSPINKKINFNFNSKIQLKPFFFKCMRLLFLDATFGHPSFCLMFPNLLHTRFAKGWLELRRCNSPIALCLKGSWGF